MTIYEDFAHCASYSLRFPAESLPTYPGSKEYGEQKYANVPHEAPVIQSIHCPVEAVNMSQVEPPSGCVK